MLLSIGLSVAMLTAVPEGEWVRAIPDSVSSRVLRDTGHTVYLSGPGLARLADGRWESLPGLEFDGLMTNHREYWTARQAPGPGPSQFGNVIGILTHYSDRVVASYDTANSCLDGNLFRLLGMDGMGKVVVDQRYFRGFGGPSTGVIRFDGKTCEQIELGLVGEMGAIAYGLDAVGREYFSTAPVSDVSGCGEMLRLDQGRLETLAEGVCAKKFLSRGMEVWAATTAGAWIFKDDSVRKITAVKGKAFREIQDILFDRLGVIWIGTDGYDFYPENIGLVAISGEDTVIYNKDNSGFPSYYASSLAEDPQGNVWVGTLGEGVAVFARDKSVLSLVKPRKNYGIHRPEKSGFYRDLLGRHLNPGGTIFRGARHSIPVFSR